MQFLEENNYAGHTLLRIVSRANAIIAELLRLSAHIPPVFHLEDKALRQKYGEILFDFSYLEKPDYYEQKIENNATLFELDQEFKDNYIDILKRFYLLYESIFKYISDFCHYLEEVDKGTYLQYTIESILIDETGKQLMVEALYLYGVMLLLLDMRIDGIARERMIVSYLRCVGQNELTSISNVCHICRRTGMEKGGRKPENYPQDYFARITIPERVISMIIGRLRSDDIYSQIAAYPFPEHRSAALSTQAAQIYVILFFDTNVLHNEHSTMREIVDKHFPDNWVIPWFLGYTVDLSVEWQNYKAAYNALSNTIEPNAVKTRLRSYLSKLPSLMKVLNQFLLEGVLTEEFILEKKSKLLTCLRECNVTLRWLVLHTNGTQGRKIKDILTEGINHQAILDLLLNIAQFEFILKDMFQNLIDTKEQKWNECKTEAAQRMRELGEYFSGQKALVKVSKIEKLEKWFSEEIAVTIESLDFKEITASTRKIQQLLKALVEVEQYHQLETNLQVTQFLDETRKIIKKMLRIANLGEDVMISFSIITDCAYMFEIINKYIGLMHESIKKDPGIILKLRSTFVKLSTVLQLTLIRINQAKSRDIISVSQYYSGELVSFVRRVIEVIPKSMFIALREVIDIQTNQIKEIPSKLETEQLKDYAQMDLRFRLSELTYKVSVFTKGVLAMKVTFVGLVAIDPKQLLEDGIRKELVEHISTSLHNILNFDTHKMIEFERTLLQLASTLDGFKRSFQYLQDYINIDGLKIWQEEFSRIIGFNVEQECNQFLKKKVHEWDSIYQSVAIPIPKFKPTDSQSVNFIGRLGREIIYQTAYNRTIYVDHTSAWYDLSGREVVSLRTFNLLANSVEVFGIKGIDRLFSFMVVSHIKSTHLKLSLCVKQPNTKTLLTQVIEGLGNGEEVSDGIGRIYQHAFNGFQKLFESLLDLVANIGHLQLLRVQIANILKISCKLESNLLYEALRVFNEAMLKEIKLHQLNKDEHPFPDNEKNDVIAELTPYLENVGLYDPLSQIYIISEPIKGIEILLFFTTVLLVQRSKKHEKLGILVSRSSKGIDPAPFIAGVWTLLKQLHSAYTYRYLSYIGQWIKHQMFLSDEKSNMSQDVTNMCLLLEYFSKISKIQRETIHEYIPSSIFDTSK